MRQRQQMQAHMKALLPDDEPEGDAESVDIESVAEETANETEETVSGEAEESEDKNTSEE